MKTKKDLSDLVRIFQHLNKVDITNKPIIAEHVNKEKLITESKQTESIAMGILSRKGVENIENILNDFKKQDRTKNQILLPVMAFFFDGNMKFGDVFEKTIELLGRNTITPPIVTRDGVKVGDNVITDFLKYGEFIHSTYDRKLGGTISTGSKSESDMTEDRPIFDKNGIKIFDANDRSKCIRYTQGGVTGKNYSFCIGQYTSNMYQSYRDTQTSTFYFLVDNNRDFDTDPLHIVVVDNTSNRGFLLTDSTNNTGTIAEYGNDVDGYFNYLKSKGVPAPEIFKHRPKSDEEKEEDRLLGREDRDLNWFTNLPYEYKSKYIGRGHRLSDEQFDYLWSDRNSRGTEALLKQYLNTGIPISSHQFELIAGDE